MLRPQGAQPRSTGSIGPLVKDASKQVRVLDLPAGGNAGCRTRWEIPQLPDPGGIDAEYRAGETRQRGRPLPTSTGTLRAVLTAFLLGPPGNSSSVSLGIRRGVTAVHSTTACPEMRAPSNIRNSSPE